MDKELKLLSEENQLNLLYNNNLFSLKSICEYLGAWDNYNKEQQYQLENFTKRDSNINKHFTFKGTYNRNYTYGEIIRQGVDKIIEKINKYKSINERDVFVDVGSGAGKVVLHMAIKSNFNTLVGVEIVPQRLRYAKKIQESVSVPHKSIFFIEKDILDFDLSIANVVFMNDLAFDDELSWKIYEKLSKGCHFITTKRVNACKMLKEEFEVETSWSTKLKLSYYIK